MEYTTSSGTVLYYDDFEISAEKSFKVNLPLTAEDYQTGNGEGVWGCCSDENLKELNDGETGLFFVKILNDSEYYPDLKYGTVVLCAYDGTHRPVALKSELDFYYTPITIEEKNEKLKKIYQNFYRR